jgi:hypothetical protein
MDTKVVVVALVGIEIPLQEKLLGVVLLLKLN